MTVSTLQNTQTFLGNNSTSAFNFNFNNSVPFNSSTPLASYIVIYTDSSGTQTTLAPTVYSLNFTPALPGTLWGIGGVLTYPLTGSPISSGTSVTIERTFSLQQLISISNQGDFSPQNIEAMGDIEEMQLQQVAAPIGRSIQIPVVDPSNIITTLPAAAQRASQYCAFDASGNVMAALSSPGTVPISSAMQPIVEASTTSIATGLLGYTALGTGAVLTNVTAEFHLGWLHSKDFGAKGDNSTDDTSALQLWIDACLSTGLPGYLDTGLYLISSALNVTGSISLMLTGAGGVNLASAIKLTNTTQNGIVFSGTNRLNINNIALQGANSASAGACMLFSGSSGGSVLDNIFINNAFIGIESTGGLATSVLSRLQVGGSAFGILLDGFGDSTITECYINPVGASAVGISLTGQLGGSRIINNKINGSNFNVGISANCGVSDGDLFVIGNSIEGHKAGGYGFVFGRTGSVDFNNIIISNNEFAGAGNGIAFVSVDSGWLGNVTVTGNIIDIGAGSTGIATGPATNFIISGNDIFEGAGTGISISSGAVNGVVCNNIIADQITPISNSSTSVIVINNQGYNPVGASALSPGASPWTYTAGGSPETLCISASTSITAITINGTAWLSHATAANGPLPVPLPPFGVMVITYTGTLIGNTMIY